MPTLITTSAHETQALARALGEALRGGEVLELVSDLGGGKTTFTQGLASGLHVKETVQSPTFTISRLYLARDDLELHHFDFYRLHEPGVMIAELAESLHEPQAIVVVEWGAIVQHVLPQTRLTIHIHTVGDDESARRLDFKFPTVYRYLRSAVNAFKKERIAS